MPFKTIYLNTALCVFCLLAALPAYAAPTHDADRTHYAAPKAQLPPRVDGVADEPVWQKAPWRALNNRWLGPEFSDEDFHGRYKVAWTENKIYLLVEIVDDVEWEFFEQELQHYAAAAREDTDDPLLHLALASLLGPLAVTKDVGRFAEGFQATGAEAMDSWRLAVLQATMLRVSLQEDAADQALARARDLADWTEED